MKGGEGERRWSGKAGNGDGNEAKGGSDGRGTVRPGRPNSGGDQGERAVMVVGVGRGRCGRTDQHKAGRQELHGHGAR